MHVFFSSFSSFHNLVISAAYCAFPSSFSPILESVFYNLKKEKDGFFFLFPCPRVSGSNLMGLLPCVELFHAQVAAVVFVDMMEGGFIHPFRFCFLDAKHAVAIGICGSEEREIKL